MIYVLFIYDSGGGGGLVAQSCLTPVTPWVVAYQAFCPCDSPGKNTGVDCQFLLQYMTVLGNKWYEDQFMRMSGSLVQQIGTNLYL